MIKLSFEGLILSNEVSENIGNVPKLSSNLNSKIRDCWISVYDANQEKSSMANEHSRHIKQSKVTISHNHSWLGDMDVMMVSPYPPNFPLQDQPNWLIRSAICRFSRDLFELATAKRGLRVECVSTSRCSPSKSPLWLSCI